MGQRRIEFDSFDLRAIKQFAKENNQPYNKGQYLLELAVKIASQTIENLDEESFNQIIKL
jgi:hypothetical protein